MWLIELLAAVSVICCVFYLYMNWKKNAQNADNPFRGVMLGKYAVSVRYENSQNPMMLYFYTDGFVFEKDGGNKLFVRSKNVVKITELKTEADTEFCYRLTFDPEVSGEDTLDIISKEELTGEFTKIVDVTKICQDN